jgi:hypothetical protein
MPPINETSHGAELSTTDFFAAPLLYRKRTLEPNLNVHFSPLQKPTSSDSLKFVLPSTKRSRREPWSSSSAGKIHGPLTQGSSATSTRSTSLKDASSGSAFSKVQSVVRGLEHMSNCTHGCSNPLCVSTRKFVAKVSSHLEAMKDKSEHILSRCAACQLWKGIVKSHAALCKVDKCSIPLCDRVK